MVKEYGEMSVVQESKDFFVTHSSYIKMKRRILKLRRGQLKKGFTVD